MNNAFLSFNGGEVSELARHRNDLAKLATCQELLANTLPLPYGSACKRPGLQWVGNIGALSQNCAHLPFTASDGTEYILSFQPNQLKIYDTNCVLKDTVTFMNGYSWPGTQDWENTIRQLYIEQINDVAFISHPGTFPLQLRRLSDTNWELDFIPFTQAPVLDQNLDKNKTFTIASNPVAATWTTTTAYSPGDVVFTDSEWECIRAHTSGASTYPGTGTDWKDYWKAKFYEAGDAITLISDNRSASLWSKNKFITEGQKMTVGGTFTPGTDLFYRAMVDHYSDGGSVPDFDYTLPLPPGSEFLRIHPWSNSGTATFQVDRYYYHNGVVYLCIVSYSNATVTIADYEPGVGATWQDYWEATNYTIDAAEIVDYGDYTGNTYAVDDQVVNGGTVYTCTQAHTASDDKEPGVGASWASYWDAEEALISSFLSNAFSPGNYFKISPDRPKEDYQAEIQATKANNYRTSKEIIVQGDYDIFSYGTANGEYQLQRSSNSGKSWETIKSWDIKADRNISYEGTEAEAVWLRLRWINRANPSSGTTPRMILVPREPYVTGFALLDTYVSDAQMTGTAKTSLMSGNTYRWHEGAFNTNYGFPKAMVLHESRLLFAGTDEENGHPTSIWASKTEDLFNFEPGTNDTDGFFVTLQTPKSNPIRWMASQRRLFVGTKNIEFVLGSETADQALTPLNINARKYTTNGSAAIPPFVGNDAVLFLERNAARLRALGYDDATGSYGADNLTRLAEHIAQAGISNMAWQSTREPTLWCVLRDGEARAFSWDKSENVAAWSRHTTQGGEFYDVVIFPNDDGDDDVFFMVKRGTDVQMERFPQNWLKGIEDNDAWLAVDGAVGNSALISIPEHLRTDDVTQVLTPYGVPDVSSQDFTSYTEKSLPSSQQWQIGWRIPSEIISTPIEVGMEDGMSLGRSKAVKEIDLSFYLSRGGAVWSADKDKRQAVKDLDNAGKLASGWVTAFPDQSWDLRDAQFKFYHDDPFPFILRAAVCRLDLSSD